jgi:hypothetical protein
MKHKITLLILAVTLSSFANAQTIDTVKYWSFKGDGGLSFSQVSLTNWSAGGENTLATNAMVNLFGNYKKDKFSWDNSLNLAYGFMSQQSIKNKKTDDKIDLSSKAGIYAFKKWDYAILFGFKSQFADGFNYPNDSVVISKFLAPGYLQFAIGMDYKPSDVFSLFISPLGARITFVNDTRLSDLGAFGVDPATYTNDSVPVLIKHGKSSRLEAGASLKAIVKKDLVKNVTIGSKLELFSNYVENPQNIIVNWEVLIALKVNSFITTTIGTQLIYDDNVTIGDKDGKSGPRTQFKETIGVGLAFKFGK